MIYFYSVYPMTSSVMTTLTKLKVSSDSEFGTGNYQVFMKLIVKLTMLGQKVSLLNEWQTCSLPPSRSIMLFRFCVVVCDLSVE